MTVVIFEGLPGSGKSTITKELSKKFNFCVRTGEVILRGGEEVPITKHYGKNWDYFTRSDINKIELSKKKFGDKIVLLDRGFPSTISHGFARELVEKDSPIREIVGQFRKEIRLDESEVYYVYLKSSPEVSLRRSKHPPEDIWGKIPQLNATQLFYEIFFLFRKNVFVIDTRKHNLNSTLKMCENIVLRIREKHSGET